jgi:hypothetical protein
MPSQICKECRHQKFTIESMRKTGQADCLETDEFYCHRCGRKLVNEWTYIDPAYSSAPIHPRYCRECAETLFNSKDTDCDSCCTRQYVGTID